MRKTAITIAVTLTVACIGLMGAASWTICTAPTCEQIRAENDALREEIKDLRSERADLQRMLDQLQSAVLTDGHPKNQNTEQTTP